LKIAPLNEALRFISQVRDKADSDGNSRQQQQQKQQQDSQPEHGGAEAEPVNDAKVGAAIESFQHDAQTQQHGLSASQVGQGPGLKVVLKDGTGAIVRQFTGEEFVRLREAASKDGRVRGKILDQKL
jgi:hypothetical protein